MFTDILQPTHLLFILVVALVVLGPKRLPEVARTLGNGLRDFREAISGESDERPGRPGHFLADDPAPDASAAAHAGEPAAPAHPAMPEPPPPLPPSTVPVPAAPAPVPETQPEPASTPQATSEETDTVVQQPVGESVTAVHETAPTTPPAEPQPRRERDPAPPDNSSGPPQT